MCGSISDALGSRRSSTTRSPNVQKHRKLPPVQQGVAMRSGLQRESYGRIYKIASIGLQRPGTAPSQIRRGHHETNATRNRWGESKSSVLFYPSRPGWERKAVHLRTIEVLLLLRL